MLSSNSAYDGTKDVLINELDDLIDVHFEDVITQLDDALSRLDDLPNEFSLKSDVWDIYSTLRDRATSNKASAQTAKEVIEYLMTAKIWVVAYSDICRSVFYLL